MSLLRGQGNHNHIPTILVLLRCFLSSAEEEERKGISVFDVEAIREGSKSQMMKYPSSKIVEIQNRYERQISDHPCFQERFARSSILRQVYKTKETNQVMSCQVPTNTL